MKKCNSLIKVAMFLISALLGLNAKAEESGATESEKISAISEQVDLKWRARGLQARDFPKDKKKSTKGGACRTSLEIFLTGYGIPGGLDLLKVKNGSGFGYKILLQDPSDFKPKDKKFVYGAEVQFLYKDGFDFPGGLMISNLANDWLIFTFAKTDNDSEGVVILSKNCRFVVNRSKPFDIEAADSR